MKSLEILDKLIEKEILFFGTSAIDEEIEIIKADLEVLEILRKYLHKDSWGDLTLEIRDLNGCEYQSKYYKEECEDYNKVKQWLEENKDE